MCPEAFEFEPPELGEDEEINESRIVNLMENKEEEIYPDDLFTDIVPESADTINGFKFLRWLRALVNDINSGYAPVVVVCGKEGRGKSMVALRLAEILHREVGCCLGDWTVENLAYGPVQFLDRMRSSIRQALIFDEAGVNLNKNQYNSVFNRSVDSAVQTQRMRENIYIFVLPKASDLDPRLRNRVEYKIRLMGKRDAGRKGKGDCEITYYEYNFGKMETEDTKREELIQKKYNFELPSEDIREEYRKREGEFKLGTLDKMWKKAVAEKREEKKEEDKKRASAW